MNIKLIPLVTFLFIFISGLALGQQKSVLKDWPHSSKNCHHLLSNASQCSWKFFAIKGTLEGTVIAFDQSPKDEKEQTAASVAIIRSGKDTIRVLLMGKVSRKPGDHIKVVPANEPSADISVPLDRDFYIREEKSGGKPICRINEYDGRILKTTWGKVVE